MNNHTPIIEIKHLNRKYGQTDAVHDLNLSVPAGKCYGFFGRNGAGKTTTIKCLLNLIRPTSGAVRMFGLDPQANEVAVKTRIAYVPDSVAFYPWMTVQSTLDYLASFRTHWNKKIEQDLLGQFRLDASKRTNGLSKGEKMQLALIGAVCPEPELLILDEPTSGLDPIVRREFIQTVIGAYQEADPEHRTIFVSTHQITEFEGLIDEFTIIEQGHDTLTLNADEARERFTRIRARFAQTPPKFEGAEILETRQEGRELTFVVYGEAQPLLQRLRQASPETVQTEALTLEEIFLVSPLIKRHAA